jgi:hypothetical protein
MTSGSNLGEAGQLSVPLPEDPAPPLNPYSEADAEDAATRFFETPRPEPTWIVQVTLFDRRLMTQDGLLDELRRGRLVHGHTPVWRVGMPDWRALAYVEELRAAVPAPQRREPARGALGLNGGGWRRAAALAFVALTLSALVALFQR